MTSNTAYFTTGIFVLLGLALAVVGVLVLGAGDLLREHVLAETYFDQSVQGLDIGSPVKFKGVQVGRVNRISFTGTMAYERGIPVANQKNYVYVEIALLPGTVDPDPDQVRNALQTMVTRRGLRAKLSATGLTGALYVELDEIIPAPPQLPIFWDPQHYYIPSAPTARISDVGESINRLASKMEQVDFASIGSNLDALLSTVERKLAPVESAALNQQSLQLIEEMRQTNQSLRQLVEGESVQNTVTGLARTVERLDRLTEQTESGLRRVVERLEEASASMAQGSQAADEILRGPEVQQALRDLPLLMRQLRTASEDLHPVLRQVVQGGRRVNQILASQQYDWSRIFTNLRLASDDIRELTGLLKKFPSIAVFGEPPQPVGELEDE